MQSYLDDFEQMEKDVKTLKQALTKFLDETINPLSEDTQNLPASTELEVHSLVQKTTDLSSSLSLIEQKIEDVHEAGINFYSIIGFVNELESSIEEWESGFDGIKETWGSIVSILNQSTSPAESVEPENLLTSIMDDCGRIQQFLGEAHLKIFVYKRLEPSINKISNQVKELKERLKEMMEDWLPKREEMQQLMEPLMEESAQFTDISYLENESEDAFTDLLEKQRSLYELFARWQLFKKVEPNLHNSLSQLESLEQSFEEALKEWHPADGQVNNLYQSVMEKYKQLNSRREEGISLSEKYGNLQEGFERFEEEWNLALRDLAPIVEKWVKRG